MSPISHLTSSVRGLVAVEPLSRLQPIGERTKPPTAVLGPATLRLHVPRFEQALRDAIAGLKESMARIALESDPLTRHLGFRALNRDAKARHFEPEKLSEPDDQQYAKELLKSVEGRETQSLDALDPNDREDLETLLRFETRTQERIFVSTQRAAATQVAEDERSKSTRLEQEVARQRAAIAQLPEDAKPVWLRVMGVVMAVLSLGFFLLVLRESRWLPVLRWSSALGALSMVAIGAWLGSDPHERRVWLVAQFEELAKWREDAAARDTRAKEELTRALKLFESVDAECQREEAAALAVLKRRPGADRYVSASGSVVVFEATP
jgi:hypothetical protein